MKSALALLFFLFNGSFVAFSQNSITLLNLPLKYFTSPDGEILKKSQKEKSSQYWIVFSDRADNKVYESPDESKAAISTANFLDKFYVTDETDEYLELYKWEEGIKLDNVKKRNELDPAKAHKVGWIKKENLLLWNRCLENKNSRFAKKGFIIIDSKNILDGDTSNTVLISLYKNPDTKIGQILTKPFQILYVYKHIGNKLLLGRVLKSNVYRISTEVAGWIDDSQFQFWEGRMFIEPNRDSRAILERKSTRIKAALFVDKTMAAEWSNGKNDPSKTAWYEDSIEQKLQGFQKRFPIFERDGNIVNTGFLTSLFTSKTSGNEYVNESDKNKINPVVKNFIQEKGTKIDEKLIYSKFNGKNPAIFIPAFTSISIKNLTQPVFELGIYISEDELVDLIKKFESLMFEQKIKTPRKNIYEAYQRLALAFFDEESLNNNDLKNKITLDTILSKVTGISCKSPILKEILLVNIKDDDKVSFEQLEQLQTTIRNSLELLKNVTKDSGETMRDISGGNVFYWVPEDYFP